MATTQPRTPTVALRRLSKILRELRAQARWTADDAATALDYSQGKLSRIELGRWKRPIVRDVRDLLDLYSGRHDNSNPDKVIKLAQKQRDSILELAKFARTPPWWRSYSDILGDGFAGFEAAASTIRSFQVRLLPGLLQTPAYAAAVTRASLVKDPAEVAKRVEVRTKRQQILLDEDPPQLWVIITESALCLPFGTVDDQIEQLQRLADTDEIDHITIQVLKESSGVHPAMTGGFVILDFSDPEDVAFVYTEGLTDARTLEEPQDLETHNTVYQHLQAMALSPDESIGFLRQMIRNLK